MTERRPHWDDDLIEAVSCLVSVDIGDDCLVVADVYAIIAAVEDWHEKFVMHGAFRVLAERAASAEADRDRLANQLLNEVPDSYIQMKARALTAEAAIARVRELHRPCSDPPRHLQRGRCCLECSDYGRQGVVRMYPCDTLNALEGGSDD